MPFLRRLVLLLCVVLGTACGGADAPPGSVGNDAASGGDASADAGSDGASQGDSGSDASAGLTSADLVGTYTANSPAGTPCYVTLFDQTVVQIAAVDSNTVTIGDGTSVTFTCDIVGDTLACAPVNGTTSAVQIGPSTYCEWPYTVTATIANVSPGGFFAMVQFATQPSPTSNSCSSALGVCMGTGGASFLRFFPTPSQPSTPPPSAVVKRSAPI